MLKKIFVLTLCALMLLTSAMAEEWADVDRTQPLNMEHDMGLYVGGTWYPILNYFEYLPDLLNEVDPDDPFYDVYVSFSEISGLHRALGEELDSIASPSCGFNGEDIEYLFDGMSIYTNPLGDYQLWFEAYITGGDWVTSRGIGIGSSLDDVKAAYGEPQEDDGDYITYFVTDENGEYKIIESPQIMFGIDDNGVNLIDIYYPTNTI